MHPHPKRTTSVWAMMNVGIGALVIAALSVAFAISFAALIFKGPLAPLLSQGIGLTLLSATIAALVGAITFSFRGTVNGPQDITAILLGGAAGSIALSMAEADQSALLTTVIFFVGGASFVAGLASYVFGRLRLGYLARFVPYPVVGGFLAATGYLLAVSSFGMMISEPVTIFSLPAQIMQSDPLIWLPWVLGGFAIMAMGRSGVGDFGLPLALFVSAALFYAVLWWSGISIDAARAQGLLLGPFADFGLAGVTSAFDPTRVEWSSILAQLPTILAIVCLTILGTLLNSTGLEMALNEPSNLEKDLRAAGAANMASGVVGGLPSYQLIGETLLAKRLKLAGPVPGIAAATGCVLALIFGATLFSFIPVGLLAMLIAYLGFDLIATWLWDARARLSPSDYSVIWIIVLAAAFTGFLQAIAVGVLAAIVIFVLSYARLNVVRLRSTAANRRSRVERSDSDVAILAAEGQNVIVLELSGYLFFGSAQRLTRQFQNELTADHPPKALFLDFRQVNGFDGSVIFALLKLYRDCASRDIDCVFSGMSTAMELQYTRTIPQDEQARMRPTLEHVLQEWEQNTLRDAAQKLDHTTPPDALVGFFEELLHQGTKPAAINILQPQKDDVLVTEGSTSTDIFVLKSGTMRAEVIGPDGDPIVVARFLEGALLGEIAFYAKVPRTASIVAEDDCVVYQLDPDRLFAEQENLAGRLHGIVAGQIARRLVRVTQLVKDAGI